MQYLKEFDFTTAFTDMIFNSLLMTASLYAAYLGITGAFPSLKTEQPFFDIAVAGLMLVVARDLRLHYNEAKKKVKDTEWVNTAKNTRPRRSSSTGETRRISRRRSENGSA